MIYTEGSHITADTEAELHALAKRCGMSRGWYQGEGTRSPGRYWMFGNARKLVMRESPEYITKAEFDDKCKIMISNGKAHTK